MAKASHVRPLLKGHGGDDHLRRGGCQQRRRAALRGVRLVGDACLGFLRFLGRTGYGGDGESMVFIMVNHWNTNISGWW